MPLVTCETVGPLHPAFKGRKTDSNGYVHIWDDEQEKYVREHRLIMESYLGRSLEQHEVVHHKNNDRACNWIENLELTTHSEHSRRHRTGTTLSTETKTKISKAAKELWKTRKQVSESQRSR